MQDWNFECLYTYRKTIFASNHTALKVPIYLSMSFNTLPQKFTIQVAQLSQRDRAAGWVSYGQKWKTGTGRQYLHTL